MESQNGQQQVPGPYPPHPAPQPRPGGAGEYRPESPGNPASGLRIAAGILAILTGLWAPLAGIMPLAFLDGLPGLSGPAALLTVAAGIGSLVTGIVVLATARSRTPRAPVVLLAFAAVALAGLSLVAHYGPPPGPLPAMASVILICLALRREQAPGTVIFDGRGGLGIAVGMTSLLLSTMEFGDLALLEHASGLVELPAVLHLIAGPASLLSGIWLVAGFGRHARKAPVVALAAVVLCLAAAVLQAAVTDLGASGPAILTALAAMVLTLLVIRRNRGAGASAANP